MTLDLTRFGQWRKYGILKSFVNSFPFSWPFNYVLRFVLQKESETVGILYLGLISEMLLCLLFFQMSSKTDWPSSFWFEGGKNCRLIVGILYCLCHIVTKIREINMVIFSQSSNLDKSQMFVQATQMLTTTYFFPIVLFVNIFSKPLKN